MHPLNQTVEAQAGAIRTLKLRFLGAVGSEQQSAAAPIYRLLSTLEVSLGRVGHDPDPAATHAGRAERLGYAKTALEGLEQVKFGQYCRLRAARRLFVQIRLGEGMAELASSVEPSQSPTPERLDGDAIRNRKRECEEILAQMTREYRELRDQVRGLRFRLAEMTTRLADARQSMAA